MIAAFFHHLRFLLRASLVVLLAVFVTPRTAFPRPPTKPAPLRLVRVRALPLPLRQSIPAHFQCSGGVHRGDYWFVWYCRSNKPLPPEYDEEVFYTYRWHVAIWKTIKQSKRSVLRCLRVVALPQYSAVPIWDLVDSQTDWLRPRERRGPIWGVRGVLWQDTYYVFPNGYGGPVWVASGGGGVDAGHLSGFYPGPIDKRGFRSMVYMTRNSALDKYGGGDADDITTTPNYWTGKGWYKGGKTQFQHVEPPKPTY